MRVRECESACVKREGERERGTGTGTEGERGGESKQRKSKQLKL